METKLIIIAVSGWITAGACALGWAKTIKYLDGWRKLTKDYRRLSEQMIVDLQKVANEKNEKADAMATLAMDKENDEHDCHFVGGGGESGCSHPSHKRQPEP